MRRTLWSSGALVAVLLAPACTPPPDDPVPNAREVVRAALLEDGSSCFADIRAYCIDDPSFIDAVLDKVVATRFKGEFPDRRRGVDRLIKAAKGPYTTAQFETEELREQVMAKMRARFENPPSREEKGRVFADLGVVPTKFESARSGWFIDRESPLLDGLQLHTREVATHFLRLRQANENATHLVLRVQVPEASALSTYLYTWYLADDKVSVYPPVSRADKWVTTDPLGDDLAPLANGTLSLSKGLHTCATEDSSADPLCPAWWPEH